LGLFYEEANIKDFNRANKDNIWDQRKRQGTKRLASYLE